MDATTTDTPLPNNNDTHNDTLLALSSDDNDTPMATDKKKTTIDLSDSDNDSDDQGGLTGVDNLNISARLKRLMRDTTLTSALDDDDDSDDDDDPLKDNVLFRTPAAVKTPAVQSLLRTEPSPRLDKSNYDDDSSSNDEGNDMIHQRLPAAVSSPTANRHPPRQRRPLDFFAGNSESSSSSSSSENEQQQKQPRRRRQQQPKKTRQKKKTSSTTPAATAAVSDDDSEDDNEDEDGKKRKRPPKRAMSKRAERLMHQENQRLTRTTVAKLQPRTDKLSFNHVMEKFKQQRLLSSSSSPPQDKSPNTMIREKVKALNDDSDSDLEIVHPQAVKEVDFASPDRPRLPFEQFQSSPSPLRNRPMTHRDLNKRLQDMMAKEMLERRRHMEEKARATGTFKTTEEIVRHQLALEKQAQQIGMQVNEHFIRESGRKSRPSNDDDKVPDEEDEDVFEELFLSGEEEGEEEEVGEDDNEEDVHMEENGDDKENEATNPPEAMPKDDGDDQPIRKRKRNNVLFSDDDEEASDTGSEKQVDQPMEDNMVDTAATAAPPIKHQRKEKSEYLDAEAQESEDEYFGAGGPDADEDEDDARLDQYEKDGMLVDKTDEHVDEATLRAALNSQLAESDKHMVERLLKDIMSGDLRRRRAAREAGLMLDDYDIYDDPEDNDLIALRRAANERRKRLLDQSGDPIQALARDPKTAAFAKALQSMPEDPQGLDLSDHEQEDDMMQGSDGDDDEDEDDDLDPRSNLSLVIPEDEEEQEDEAPDSRHMMTLDDSDEEQGLAVVERQERPVITRDQRMRDQQRQRLKRLLAESGGNLGAPAENSARVGLTAKSQPTERKVARYMELPKAALDESPLQKREPRLLGMLKPPNKR